MKRAIACQCTYIKFIIHYYLWLRAGLQLFVGRSSPIATQETYSKSSRKAAYRLTGVPRGAARSAAGEGTSRSGAMRSGCGLWASDTDGTGGELPGDR